MQKGRFGGMELAGVQGWGQALPYTDDHRGTKTMGGFRFTPLCFLPFCVAGRGILGIFFSF